MAFKAVKTQRKSAFGNKDALTFDAAIAAQFPESRSRTAPDQGANKAQRARYDLASSISIVRNMETSPGRAAVFEEIKAKNPLYALVDRAYGLAGRLGLQPLVLFVYMVKCAVSIGPFKDRGAQAVSIAQFANEHKTIDRVAQLVPQVKLLRLTLARKHSLSIAALRNAALMLTALPRIWPFLKTLTRGYSFMPAARMASVLAFYQVFAAAFQQRPALKAAIIASNYSPEALGMAAAAHRHGARVIYANHAPVPANGAVVPPVLADGALFYGAMTAKIYSARSACTAKVALIGQPGKTRAMEWRDGLGTIGIFLTSGTRVDVLKSLIASIRVSHRDARIIIRQHPVTLLKTDFSQLELADDRVELTLGKPLDEEIAACDLVICGNSGVALNVLSGGRPVAYLSSLDGIAFDANGFVASRLVYSMPWWIDDIYERVKGFYTLPAWRAIMRDYDASYGADLDALHSKAAIALRGWIEGGAEAGAGDGTRQNLTQTRVA